MIKIAVIDDYQNVFQQIVEVDKFKGKFDFKVFNEPFSNEKEAIVERPVDLHVFMVYSRIVKFQQSKVNAVMREIEIFENYRWNAIETSIS